MPSDDSTDGHGCEESHEVCDHVGDAHQGSGEVWGDVDVVGVEAAIVEAVEANGDAE